MFAISLSLANRTRSYSIRPTTPFGWEVRFEEDRTVRRLDHYEDWHRVERALGLFEREATELTKHGWQVAAVSR